jgi:hypothetical protein
MINIVSTVIYWPLYTWCPLCGVPAHCSFIANLPQHPVLYALCQGRVKGDTQVYYRLIFAGKKNQFWGSSLWRFLLSILLLPVSCVKVSTPGHFLWASAFFQQCGRDKVYGNSEGTNCYLANVFMWESEMMDSGLGDSRYSPRV